MLGFAERLNPAYVLLESQGIPKGKLTGNDATLTGGLTGESRDGDEGEAPEDTLTLAGLFTRLERVEAILSTITSKSTGELTGEAAREATSITGESTGNAQTAEAQGAVTVTEAPSSPVAELTDAPQLVHPAKLPLKRVAALSRRAKNLSAQGVSWKAIAQRLNAEGVPTLTGQGRWHGSTVAKLVRSE
jgi:hypothetical protein